MTAIPLARPELGEAEIEAVRSVISSGWVTQGPKVREFESTFAEVTMSHSAVAVSSCTAGLHLALLASGVEEGDEVIVPSMSFIATANAVVHAGGVPVFAEVEPDTFNLDLADVAGRITDRTRAIMLVHQLGLPGDISEFASLAAEKGLALVEDAACAIGSSYDEKPIGAHGNLTCFSFHPRKLVTTGDGGMVVTPDDELAALLRRLRHHGMSVTDAERHSSSVVVREEYLEVGFNYRLTDVQAAMGLAQLDRLPTMVEQRNVRRQWYDQLLDGFDWIDTPVIPPNRTWNVQTYAVRLRGFNSERRDAVMQNLLDKGVATRPGVMTAHRERAYRDREVSLPVSEAASDGSLAIPMYGGLTETQAEKVVSLLAEATKRT